MNDPDDQKLTSDPTVGIASLGQMIVRALLDRYHVPKHKHTALVTEILGLSYSQGHRRLTSNASWSLEELQTLGAHFGETLSDLVSYQQIEGLVNATFLVGNTSRPCRVVPGSAIRNPETGSMIATLGDSGWLVMQATPALMTLAHEIERLWIEPRSPVSRRIAVLDDHQDSAQAIVDFLGSKGFDAIAFTSLDKISVACLGSHFDGYVLDWLIGNDSSLELLAAIRSRDALCPIIVLTGQMQSGKVHELDIAEAMSNYKVKFFDKPARLSLIAAALSIDLQHS